MVVDFKSLKSKKTRSKTYRPEVSFSFDLVYSKNDAMCVFAMCFYQPVLYIIHNGDPFEQEFALLLIALYGL